MCKEVGKQDGNEVDGDGSSQQLPSFYNWLFINLSPQIHHAALEGNQWPRQREMGVLQINMREKNDHLIFPHFIHKN